MPYKLLVSQQLAELFQCFVASASAAYPCRVEERRALRQLFARTSGRSTIVGVPAPRSTESSKFDQRTTSRSLCTLPARI